MSRVEGGIQSTVHGNSGKDEEESVCDKCGRRLGKAEWTTKVPGEVVLRGVIGHGKASRNTWSREKKKNESN